MNNGLKYEHVFNNDDTHHVAHADISRRRLFGIGASMGLAPLLSYASDYPSRAVSLIVGASSGGSVDIGARIISTPMSEIMGVPVIVDNKPGATGVISTKYVGKAPQDGYTLLIGTPSASVVGPQTMQQQAFNPLDEIVGVNLITRNPLAIAVGHHVKASSLKELVELSKQRQVTLGVPGIGGVSDFLVKQINKFTGAKFESVPYKGLGAAITDAIGGQIDGAASDLGPFLPFQQGGKLKILAVTSEARAPLLPNVPTVNEAYSGFVANNWLALFAPAKTPSSIIDKVNAALVKATEREDVKNAFHQSAAIMAPMKNPAEFQKFFAAEYAQWRKTLKDQGVIKG